MDNKEKFVNFLEAIKTDENAKLIENVSKGFNACCEAGGLNIPLTVVGGQSGMPMSSNLPRTKAPALDVDEEQVPEIDPEGLPRIEDATADDKDQLKQEIFKLLANPDFKDIVKEMLIKEGAA